MESDIINAIKKMRDDKGSIRIVQDFIEETIHWLATKSDAFKAIDEDCAQLVMERILRYQKRLVEIDPKNIRSYIRQMAKNTCLDLIKAPPVSIISLSIPTHVQDDGVEIQVEDTNGSDVQDLANASEVADFLYQAIEINKGAKKRALMVVKWSMIDGITDERIIGLPNFLQFYTGVSNSKKTLLAQVRQDRKRGLDWLKVNLEEKNEAR